MAENFFPVKDELQPYRDLYARLHSLAQNIENGVTEENKESLHECCAAIWDTMFQEKDETYSQSLLQVYHQMARMHRVLTGEDDKDDGASKAGSPQPSQSTAETEPSSSQGGSKHSSNSSSKPKGTEAAATAGPDSSPQKSGENDAEACRQQAVREMRQEAGSGGLAAVAGLVEAKELIRVSLLLPRTHPHLFQGGAQRWRRLLLYGPPGTGKTSLARAVASELRAPFYYVSCSDVLSSWFGETEKMVRSIFQHTRTLPDGAQPVLFLDEIDSVCRRRCAREDDQTRRLKTELLRHMEGVPGRADPLLLLAATNCPWDIDPAFIRRFQRLVYVPLPDPEARQQMMRRSLSGAGTVSLSAADWAQLVSATDGFSGSDLANLSNAALLRPLRELQMATHWRRVAGGAMEPAAADDPLAKPGSLQELPPQSVRARPVRLADFLAAVKETPQTVTRELLQQFAAFGQEFRHT